MSYCRFGPDSDVYVFEDISGGFTCCGCRGAEADGWTNVPTAEAMIAHLETHRANGDTVPQRALDRLAETAGEGAESDAPEGGSMTGRLVWITQEQRDHLAGISGRTPAPNKYAVNQIIAAWDAAAADPAEAAIEALRTSEAGSDYGWIRDVLRALGAPDE